MQSSSEHLRSARVASCTTTDTVLALFLLASVPAHFVWAWSAGQQMLAAGADALGGWRAALLPLFSSAPADSIVASALTGMSFTLPLLVVSAVVSLLWAQVFARLRSRPLDPGWFMLSWLYVLLVPADLPLSLAAIGISFAAVIGQHVFGGTGRYIVSPAALGALFIQFSYPAVGTVSLMANWDVVASASVDANLLSATVDSAIPVMALACAAGAGLLARADALAWRTIAGAAGGLALGAWMFAQRGELPVTALPWYWHLVSGAAPVCLAFVMTDPSTSPLTRGGRWMHGLVFGFVIVAIRVLDPSHPDGTLFAILIATLTVPLIDYCVLRLGAARNYGRLELRQ